MNVGPKWFFYPASQAHSARPDRSWLQLAEEFVGEWFPGDAGMSYDWWLVQWPFHNG